MKMIIHDGKRYRPEDAERLGLTTRKASKPTAKKATTKKATARNKARTVEDEATGGSA